MLTNFVPDLLDTDSGDLSVSDYQYIVSHPGKFEGESTYVPYMWDRILEWGDIPDDDATSELWESWGIELDSEDEFDSFEGLPEVYRFDVDLIEYTLFPELLEQGITAVYLYETEQGFVDVFQTAYMGHVRDLDPIQTVADIPDDYTLVQDSQDLQAITESTGIDLSDYGCLFVLAVDGDYSAIYGCSTYIPYMDRSVDKLL